MTIRDAIIMLLDRPMDENIIFAFWGHEEFPDVSQEDWDMHVETVEHKTDWSHAHDGMTDYFNELKEEEEEDGEDEEE